MATVAVAAVLIAAGLGLVLFQRSALTSSVDQNLTQRADDLSALLQRGTTLPDSFVPTARKGFTQLVGLDGAVLVSSPDLAGAPQLPLDVPDRAGDSLQTVAGLDVDDDSFRVLSRRLPNLGVLYIGATLDVVAEAATALATALLVIIPIVVAALGALVWWLVGRTLQPVEEMRSEVAGINSADLDHRVPRPNTGDEIDRLAGTMNEMLSRLEGSVTRQQRFVADASHELRSPLTRLRSQLEVVLVQTGDPLRTAELRSLLDDVVGMQEVVGRPPLSRPRRRGTHRGCYRSGRPRRPRDRGGPPHSIRGQSRGRPRCSIGSMSPGTPGNYRERFATCSTTPFATPPPASL